MKSVECAALLLPASRWFGGKHVVVVSITAVFEQLLNTRFTVKSLLFDVMCSLKTFQTININN